MIKDAEKLALTLSTNVQLCSGPDLKDYVHLQKPAPKRLHTLSGGNGYILFREKMVTYIREEMVKFAGPLVQRVRQWTLNK